MKIVCILVALLFVTPAEACIAQIFQWEVEAPKADVVAEGIVTGEEHTEYWNRIVHVEPTLVRKGKWSGLVKIRVACAHDKPRLGERVLIMRLGRKESLWVIIPVSEEAGVIHAMGRES